MKLLVNLKNGDPLAFEQAYRAYNQKVYRYFIKKTVSAVDAEDLLQNTFLKLWKYRSSLNENYLLEQHLFIIAKTVFIDYTRSLNTRKKITVAVHRVLNGQFNQSDTNSEDIQKLNNILNEMPDLRKKAFIMNKLEGYSYKEIADELSVNVKAVDNHVARALKQLRKAFLALFTF